jgi:hypothetical protein
VVDWLTARTKARRDIHAALSYAATYEDSAVTVPVPITVRWHSKAEIVGNINGGDYAEILSTIQRLLFNSEELATANGGSQLSLKRGGVVKLTDFGDYQLKLDSLDPVDGPIKISWVVSHQ